jgi:DNA-binding MarR family transcriptional regulator
MNTISKSDVEKIRISKQNDPDINLYIILDQADSIVTSAIELEIKHLRMTQPQARILTMLSRENRPVTIEELANWTFKEFNSVSTLINRMEKKGLVEKKKKEGDLKTYIVLTDKGSDLFLNQVTEHSIHMIFDKLSEQEKDQLHAILKKVRDTASGLMGLGYRPPFLP